MGLTANLVEARKEHVCNVCQRPIIKGTVHWVRTENGGTSRWHKECGK